MEDVSATKVCSKCKAEKDRSEFYKTGSHCKECLKFASLHKDKSKPKLTNCKECGVEIKNAGGSFCSRSCASKFQHQSPPVEVVCNYCGKAVLRKASRVKKQIAHFCDAVCQAAYDTEVRNVDLTCETCGVTIRIPANRKKLSRFCSKKCDSIWRASLTGEASFNWRGGTTTETELARTTREIMEWKYAVYKRDKYTCQKCGFKGKGLNAHHIKRFRDYPELRTTLENGILLCKVCHKIETDREHGEDKLLRQLQKEAL